MVYYYSISFLCAFGWLFFVYLLLLGFSIITLVFLILVWPFFIALINARALGEVGYSIVNVLVREITFIATLSANKIPVYSDIGVGVWLLPLLIGSQGYPDSSTWVSYFYTARYVGLEIKEVIKAVVIIAIPLSLIISFLYTNIIWAFSPIPSLTYPWVSIYWPINVIQSCLWITRSATVFKSAILNQVCRLY